MNVPLRVAGLLPRSWLKAVGRAQWRHPVLKGALDWAAARLADGDQVIQQGVGRRLCFNATGSHAGYVLGTSEPHVQEALAALITTGMTVYDVGAHIGFFSLIAARLAGDTGQVVCFEPFEENVERLRHNIALNGLTSVHVRCEALGGEDGSATFVLSDVPSWGRLASTPQVSPATGEIQVSVCRLDTVIARGAPPPDLIKIDVEGAEAELLSGGRLFLQQQRPLLVIELHGTNAAVAGELDTLGYRSIVLGHHVGVREAPWYVHVVAFAPDDARVEALQGELTSLKTGLGSDNG